MTKELSAKRKVDKCRDTHPLARGSEGARAPANERRRWSLRPRPLGCPGGTGPAPSSRLALIELGLSFDFEWGDRVDLRAGKNYRRDRIPSVIGIIRYSGGSSNYAAVSLRAVVWRRDARPARRGALAVVTRLGS